MTIEERLSALEAKTQDIHRDVWVDTVTGLSIPYIQLNARLGIFTNFWSRKNVGQGAGLSVGTNIDRFAGYFEIDEQTCPDHPSVGVFGSVVPSATYPQPFIGVQGASGNSTVANYGILVSMGSKVAAIREEGLELIGSWFTFVIGKIGGVIKQIWT